MAGYLLERFVRRIPPDFFKQVELNPKVLQLLIIDMLVNLRDQLTHSLAIRTDGQPDQIQGNCRLFGLSSVSPASKKLIDSQIVEILGPFIQKKPMFITGDARLLCQ
ncbi:hypothetical protein D3C77_127140 [compost metagenome]